MAVGYRDSSQGEDKRRRHIQQRTSPASKTTDGPRVSPLGDHTMRKGDKEDQPSGGETWTQSHVGGTRSGRGQRKTGYHGCDMLRPLPIHGTLRLPNDDDDNDGREVKVETTHPTPQGHAMMCLEQYFIFNRASTVGKGRHTTKREITGFHN